MIDAIDRKILNILQSDGRLANSEIARRIELAPSAVLERIRKLEEKKVIRGYAADIDPKFLDYGLTAFVSVRTSECGEGVGESLAKVPEILEVHEVAGNDCFFIKVRAHDTDDLGRLLRESIKPVPQVLSTNTTVVLRSYREGNKLPIEPVEKTKAGKSKKGGKGK